MDDYLKFQLERNKPQGLTPAQEFHNAMLDFEIAQANRENKRREEENQRKIERWRKDHPESDYLSCPNLDLTAPKRVIGIRYV